MPGARSVTRVYMVSNSALFGEGIRSLLRGRRSIQIVGMGKDEAKSLRAMKSLRPEVVIVEHPRGRSHPFMFDSMFQLKTVGRVVALDLDHNFATVYERHRVEIVGPDDLVDLIRGRFGERGSASLVGGDHPKTQQNGMLRGKSPPAGGSVPALPKGR